MRRYHIETALALLAAVGMSLACSDDGTPSGPHPDMYVQKDSCVMQFDTGKPSDWWVPPKNDGGGGTGDTGVAGDGSTGDGGGSKDSGPACTSPTGVSCTPACTSGKLCSAAKGGMCATEVVLSGPASNSAVLKAMGNAYATCWTKNPKVDTLCSTLNTCAMTGTLTVDMVRNWVCKVATSSDFPSATALDKAKDVCGCSGVPGTNNTDWKISTIIGGGKAKVCLSYDYSSWWTDYVHVNDCANFPPK